MIKPLTILLLVIINFYARNNILIKNEQKDGVSMGASLGAILVNIIMKECEKILVDDLVKEGTIKFYVHNVDDTLLLGVCLIAYPVF